MARAASAASRGNARRPRRRRRRTSSSAGGFTLPRRGRGSAPRLAVLGDVSKPVTAGVRGGVAATPGPGAGLILGAARRRRPWRGAQHHARRARRHARLVSAPKRRVQSVRRREDGPRRGGGGGSSVAANAAEGGMPLLLRSAAARWVEPPRGWGGARFRCSSRPCPTAMAKRRLFAARHPRWTRRFGARGAANAAPGGSLARFVGEDVAKRLMAPCTGSRASSAALGDAFLVTINGVAALAGAGRRASGSSARRRGAGRRRRSRPSSFSRSSPPVGGRAAAVAGRGRRTGERTLPLGGGGGEELYNAGGA